MPDEAGLRDSLGIVERKFIVFGPHDFPLFGLALIVAVVFIMLFTVVFGRLFCRWVCPQTVFMEMVFLAPGGAR
jgi:polyferredoxin